MTRRHRALAFLALVVCLGAPRLSAGGASTVEAPFQPAIEPRALRASVEYLADDAREGRGAGTRGIEAAARFIAARLEDAGLEPAGDKGGWFQDFEVTIGVRSAGQNSLRILGHEVPFASDWMAYGFSDTGTVRAPLVFAGYGITAPEYDYDDYAGLDSKGKVVVVLRYEPGQNDSTSAFAGSALTPHSDIRRKAILAREHGATGMLVVTGPLAKDPDELAKLRPDVGYYSTGILCGQVRRAALAAALPALDLQALQQQIDSSGKPASRALGEADLEWTVGLAKERTRLRNVVGIQPGRDPHRAVLLGAHYDHLGMGGSESLAPDVHEAHHGADDNASGTAALIEIAHAFAARPDKPAETLVFVAFSGEELGLAGSSYYVKNPAFPLPSTTAMLNMDMVGRLRDRKLVVFGTSTARQFATLLDTLNAHGPKFDLRQKGDGYGPSDQMSFFKMNVPVLHFFTGPHSDYHKPSDKAALLDYDGLAAVADFVAQVADALTRQELTFVAASGPAPSGEGTGGTGFRTYLGTVPDYGQDESIQGVLLSGVRAGSPAEKAGMRGGDIIVQIGDTVIRNIQDFVFVLRTRQPDDVVDITVLRAGKRETMKTTLAKRP